MLVAALGLVVGLVAVAATEVVVLVAMVMVMVVAVMMMGMALVICVIYVMILLLPEGVDYPVIDERACESMVMVAALAVVAAALVALVVLAAPVAQLFHIKMPPFRCVYCQDLRIAKLVWMLITPSNVTTIQKITANILPYRSAPSVAQTMLSLQVHGYIIF